MTVRERPRSLEAEQAVLGSALYDARYVPRATATLKRDDFYFASHQTIFDVLIKLQLAGQTIDVLTVSHALENEGALEGVGGYAYITSLPDKVPLYSNFDAYVALVRDHAMMRRLIVSLEEVTAMAYRGDAPVTQLIDLVASRIYDIREGHSASSFEKLGDILSRTMNTLQALAEGKTETRIRTHFPTLDSMLDGLRPGAFYVLASRPGVGKTSFALNIAHQAVHHNHVTAVFSLEMSKEEIGTRVLVAESKVSATTLERLTPGQTTVWSKIADALNSLFPVPLYIDDRSGASVVEMQAKCKQLQLETGLDLVIVDYLQLMSGSGQGARRPESRQQEIADISRTLKLMARDLGVPVLALSQLSRDSAKTKRRPQLSDLRESGAIEQDADVVMFLYPLSEEAESADDREKLAHSVDLIVAKNRHGQHGTIPLGWNPALTQFFEPSRLEAPPEG